MVLLLLMVASTSSGCWGYHVRLPVNIDPGTLATGCFNWATGAADTSRGVRIEATLSRNIVIMFADGHVRTIDIRKVVSGKQMDDLVVSIYTAVSRSMTHAAREKKTHELAPF